MYYGWTNWDTWNANLWLTNDEFSYRRVMQTSDVAELQEEGRLMLWNEAEPTGVTDGIDLDKVNWQEIYDSLHDGEDYD